MTAYRTRGAARAAPRARRRSRSRSRLSRDSAGVSRLRRDRIRSLTLRSALYIQEGSCPMTVRSDTILTACTNSRTGYLWTRHGTPTRDSTKCAGTSRPRRSHPSPPAISPARARPAVAAASRATRARDSERDAGSGACGLRERRRHQLRFGARAAPAPRRATTRSEIAATATMKRVPD